MASDDKSSELNASNSKKKLVAESLWDKYVKHDIITLTHERCLKLYGYKSSAIWFTDKLIQ